MKEEHRFEKKIHHKFREALAIFKSGREERRERRKQQRKKLSK